MCRLSFIVILFSMLIDSGYSQSSPHGSNLKFQCEDCHSENSWNVIPASKKFNHDQTEFKLTGQHKAVDCRSCHTSLKFDEAKIECQNCHRDIHQNTVSPNCEKCHNTESWLVKNIKEIHNQSRFPLVGVHQNLNCNLCHSSYRELRFEVLNIDCYSCHRKDYENAKNPDHKAANFSIDCLECHTFESKGWGGGNFTHSFFPLVGGHEIKNCYSCHNQNSFSGLNRNCASCHLENYHQTRNPNHSLVGFSTYCEQCHKITRWQDASFDHDNSFFPIYSGKHKSKWNSCSDCHLNNNSYAEFSCLNCHEHNRTDMDNEHRNINGYSYDSNACLTCHPQGNGEGAFNHGNTQFPLTGAHINVSCNSCHQTGFENTPTECQVCHKDDFNQAQNPNHQQVGISTQCNSCHNTTAWVPSYFDHSNTQFPLTGAHTNTNCLSCHQGYTTGTSTICFNCHQNDYNQTTNPNHTTLGLSTECTTCHTTNPDWQPALFTIHNNYYPLTGQHFLIRENCFSCHNGNYNNTPNRCQDCHLDDFNGTTNPNHVSLQFPHQCETCHTTNGWSSSTFNHDQQYFPIFSGKHKNKWSTCTICHTNPNNYSIFSCLNCHEHNQNEMDRKHRNVSGYQYNSLACYDCHPTGNELIHIKKFRWD